MDSPFADLTDQEKRHALSKFLLAQITGPRRPHPLAYSQESRWALTMASVDSGVENHTFAWKLNTAADPDALRRAVGLLLQRYACLRSVFDDYDGRTVRFVQPEPETPFEFHDRTGTSEQDVSAEIAREASRPFDLRTGPVLRVCLFQTGRQSQTLLLTAHHIVADFWSLGIALRSLAEIYVRTLASAPIEMVDDQADYDAFVLWEARRVLGEPGRLALRHWERQFGDGLDYVQVPADRSWPATRGFKDAEYRFTIGSAIVERLKRVGQAHDSTLFAVMLTLFNILIHTYTRQPTIAVIVPVSVRSRLSFENLVGALGNHLLLGCRIEGHASFAQVLAQVNQGLVDAMAHRDFPASVATRRVRVRGVPTGAVPFPLKFNMPKVPMLQGQMGPTRDGASRLTVALDALTAELDLVDRRVTGNCELNMGCFETSGGLLGTLQYNVELFDDTTIAGIVGRLTQLAHIAGDAGGASIDDMVRACQSVTA
jgi:hypothetical protein